MLYTCMHHNDDKLSRAVSYLNQSNKHVRLANDARQ